MKTLIVDDDFTSRLLLEEILKAYGAAHIAVTGKEAVDAVGASIMAGEPYDLICLDIMMPGMDGQQALREIRALEKAGGLAKGAKVIMTTALQSPKNISAAYQGACDAYLPKPIEKATLLAELHKLGLLK